jgi:hypothetical protein
MNTDKRRAYMRDCKPRPSDSVWRVCSGGEAGLVSLFCLSQQGGRCPVMGLSP